MVTALAFGKGANVKITGVARLYRAASVLAAGLEPPACSKTLLTMN